MLSQTVLLKDVNDDANSMKTLFRTLVENRIKPYYLHHGDRTRGTGHFRTTIADGQQLMTRLRGSISGLCQPQYMLDIPGGAGKVPIGPTYLSKAHAGSYLVTDPNGEEHVYRDVGQGSARPHDSPEGLE